MDIIYISTVDISLPNGPGINEREFIFSLQSHSRKNSYKYYLIIPEIKSNIDFPLENCSFFKYKKKGKLNYYFGQIILCLQIVTLLIRKKAWLTNSNIIVIRLSRELLFLPLFLQLMNKNYYIKTLGNIYRFNSEQFTIPEKFRLKLERIILGRVLKKAFMIDVCTNQYYKNYNNIYGLNNIYIIENTVNIDRFYIIDKKQCKVKCNLDSFNRIVGYCGGSPSKRGASQLIEIAPKLIKKFKDCGIVIIGNDNHIQELEKRAYDLGIINNVRFLGQIDYQNLAPYINCFNVGIALDTDARINLIGNSSQKIKQYLACGVPVICAENTNVNIVKEGFAIAVKPNDLNSIFRSVYFYLTKTSDELRFFGKKARQYIEKNYSSNNSYDKRYEFWREII